jgi:hypothetical protein
MDQPAQNYVPPNGFTPAQINCFYYFDGAGQVAGDPLEILYRNQCFLPDEFGVIKMCHAGEKEQEEWEAFDEARNKETHPYTKEEIDKRKYAVAQWNAEKLQGYELLIDAVRQIFRMQPRDPIQGTGASWKDCIKVYNDYQEFLAKKKRLADNSQPISPSDTPDSQKQSTSPPISASS